ncbi:TPA: DUF1642 domain-containing protein [Enterococcus faecium]
MKTIEDIIRELNLKCAALKTNSVTIEQTDGNDEFKCNSHVSDFNKGKIEGLSEAKKLLEEVKQLDEPQKPVVPKFVADWFEENKDDLDNAIFGYLVFWDERDTDSVLYQWFAKSENNPIETLICMKYGYEVEKESLYCVKIGRGYFSGWDETKVTYVIDDAPDALAQRVKYETREEAEMDAIQIGGTVEEVVEG